MSCSKKINNREAFVPSGRPLLKKIFEHRYRNTSCPNNALLTEAICRTFRISQRKGLEAKERVKFNYSSHNATVNPLPGTLRWQSRVEVSHSRGKRNNDTCGHCVVFRVQTSACTQHKLHIIRENHENSRTDKRTITTGEDVSRPTTHAHCC